MLLIFYKVDVAVRYWNIFMEEGVSVVINFVSVKGTSLGQSTRNENKCKESTDLIWKTWKSKLRLCWSGLTIEGGGAREVE